MNIKDLVTPKKMMKQSRYIYDVEHGWCGVNSKLAAGKKIEGK
jgi:hypothetical protein